MAFYKERSHAISCLISAPPTRRYFRIGNGFQQIGNTAPDLAPRLAPIQRRYQFARDKLINFQQNWAPSGVALYLDRNIHDLDKPAD